MRRIVKLIILCFVLAFLLTGCRQTAQTTEVVIGVAWPFASSNNLFNEGIDLAVKEINHDGGINGKKMKLIKKDDESNLEKGLAIAESFAKNDEIQAVIGHKESFISVPASKFYDEAGLVMLSPASTAPELTQNHYRHVFRNIPSDDELARQLAIYLARQGHQRMVICYSDDAYGNGLANAFEDRAREQGITVVDSFESYTSLDDLTSISWRWRAYGADGLFLARSMPGGDQFIFDAAKVGITLPLYGGDALEDHLLEKNAGKAADGIIFGSVFNPYVDRPEVKKFVQEFYHEYKVMPSSEAALGYDAIKMLAEAIKRADGQDRSVIAKELGGLGRWSGVCGIHELSPTGDDLGDLIVLKKLQDGKFVYLDK